MFEKRALQKEAIGFYGRTLLPAFLISGTALWVASTVLNPLAGLIILGIGVGSLILTAGLGYGLYKIRCANQIIEFSYISEDKYNLGINVTGHTASCLPPLFFGLFSIYFTDLLAEQYGFAVHLGVYAGVAMIASIVGNLLFNMRLHSEDTMVALSTSVLGGTLVGGFLVLSPLATDAIAASAGIALGPIEWLAMDIALALPIVMLGTMIVDGFGVLRS